MNGETILGGTLQLLREKGMVAGAEVAAAADDYKASGSTVIHIGRGEAVLGIIVLADTLRPGAGETVRRLHAEGLRTLLLTGDNAQAAKHIAESVGVDQYQAELLPADKVDIIQRQQTGADKVCMVGDGINDAPALKAAYVGLAMGGVGSDIAVDAADAVLVQDDIARLPQLLMLARKTAQTIRINITLSMGLNLLTVILAAMGLMGPVVGALAHNAGALLIVLNSVRLLSWKYR